ncbi:MAG TPA: 2-C-methyl-D-erythritol 4-phosphate cytidylyltransferase [Chitinophagaceae bacterium]|nr:2-C-methyl-D-erythritol 4-phosphate cytidylyltransferase [Chitinophagaceae bacterium]
MKKYAVIVAGGSGTRMGEAVPKQFLLLQNKPVLYYSIKAFLDAYANMQVILVLPAEYMDMGMEVVDAYFDKDRVRMVTGGDSRFKSVQSGLELAEEDAIIFVHDGVRCLVPDTLIKRCYAKAVETGSAIPVIRCRDSIRIETGETTEALDRSKVMLVQTPQAFHGKILLPAYKIDFKDRFTDEAAVVEAFGIKVSVVEGDEQNIKITYPLDMVLAEKILSERQ